MVVALAALFEIVFETVLETLPGVELLALALGMLLAVLAGAGTPASGTSPTHHLLGTSLHSSPSAQPGVCDCGFPNKNQNERLFAVLVRGPQQPTDAFGTSRTASRQHTVGVCDGGLPE